MHIRSLFFCCMLALATMATGLGGWILTWAEAEYRLAGRLQQAVDISAAMFAVADALVAERPVTGDALLNEAPANATINATIARMRESADRAIKTASARIREASYADAPRQLEILGSIQASLGTWRGKVDEMLALPNNKRDPAFFEAFLVAVNAMSDILDNAMNIADIADLRHDGVTMDLMSFNRQLWSINTLTGHRVAFLMAAIHRQTPFPGQLKQQPWLAGRMSESWLVVDSLWARLAGIPEIAAPLGPPLAAARTAFNAQDKVLEAALTVVQDGDTDSVSAYELSRLAARTGRAFSSVRDAALTVAGTRVHDNQRTAAFLVAFTAGVVLLIMVLTIAVLIVLRWRIVTPVLALTKAIHRLALRDYEVEIPAKANRDEIGHMAAAVETLRQGAIAAAESEAQIAHMARHDSLTGLANRTLLHERMTHAVSWSRHGEKCAALCVDLDRFRTVNEIYGDPVGDRLLQAAAVRLSECVRESDTVSRIGGDEFVVLSVDLEHADAAGVLARRIVASLSEPYEIGGQSIAVGVSIGIAIAPQDATTASALLRCADTALDRAKQDDPGSFRFFEPEMDARVQARLSLERDLREAVRTDGFEVMYQPQYNLLEGRLCGFEALVRWQHPTRGLIGPNLFIPLAEETGLIVPIGASVLRKACAEAANWPATVKVAVNLSAVQFRNPALAQTVREALADSLLPASRLDLEITESLLLTDSAGVLSTLHELHDIGASISMDDFGTGYSSLSYLRSFPFDKIKIDQSFIRDLSERTDAQAIVRAVVALGNSLGMTTTAEGVETPDQLARLRQAGCTEVQGFLFSKPLPAEAARQLANGRQAIKALA